MGLNSVHFELFAIGNGTRQDCPLSPLLFALSLEPLLKHILNNLDIRGLETSKHHYKTIVYVDDLLFYVTDPITSLLVLQFELVTYGELFNFKVNLQKFEVLNVTLTPLAFSHLSSNFPFRWASQVIQYLRTKILSNLQHIFQLNIQSLMASLSTDLDKWKPLAVSCLGDATCLR